MKTNTLKWVLTAAVAAALPMTAAMADQQASNDTQPATANDSAASKAMRSKQEVDRNPMAKGATEADTTDLNKRDRDDATTLPTDQPNNSGDIETAAAVRSAIVGDDTLSMAAHNIKLVAANGKVVLRGPVKSMAEKKRVAEIATRVTGVTSVENLLEIDAD